MWVIISCGKIWRLLATFVLLGWISNNIKRFHILLLYYEHLITLEVIWKNFVKNVTKIKKNLQFLIVSSSSHQRFSVRKSVLRNFAKCTGKPLFQSFFFNKVADLRPATLLKKRFWHRCFFSEFCKISKNTTFTEHLLATASDYFYLNFGKIQNICKWICESTIWSSSVPACNYNL